MQSNSLLSHIESLNAKAQAWIDEAPGRRGCLRTTDIAYWNSIGVHTVEDFERQELECTIWDVYKEVHGVWRDRDRRARGLGLKDMSMLELKEMLTGLYEYGYAH
jgi:hypothetical protein